MLPRKNRISRKEFPAHTNIHSGGHAHTERGFRVFSPLFTAVIYSLPDKDRPSQVSIVVSKKTAKTAVARNRIRRRFYALMELYIKNLTSPTTMVIYPKIESFKASFSLLKTEMWQALKKARIM